MNPSRDPMNRYIKRLRNLLDTSVDAAERQTWQRLLAEEEERVDGKLQASEANRLRSGGNHGLGGDERASDPDCSS
jgi:hypothetical protein